MKQRRIALGINCGHDASATVCDPTGVLASIAEERLNRIKHFCGFPSRAVQAVLAQCGMTIEDVDIVAFSSQYAYSPSTWHSAVVGIDAGAQAPTAETLAFQPDATDFRRRRSSANWGRCGQASAIVIPGARVDEMMELGFFRPRLRYVPRAPPPRTSRTAPSAFALRPDRRLRSHRRRQGRQDQRYHHRGAADGSLHLLRKPWSRDSLGCFYQAVTEALGFVPIDSEYKTMGLAALTSLNGGPRVSTTASCAARTAYPRRREVAVPLLQPRQPRRRLPNPMNSVVHPWPTAPATSSTWRRSTLHARRRCTSRTTAGLVRDAMAISGCSRWLRPAAASWTCEANRRIVDQLQPDHFFVFPRTPPTAATRPARRSWPCSWKARWVLHSGCRCRISATASARTGSRRCHVVGGPRGEQGRPDEIAQALTQGEVVGTCRAWRMEAGPRAALGNRSVLADPRHVAVKDRINRLLKGREPFVRLRPHRDGGGRVVVLVQVPPTTAT